MKETNKDLLIGIGAFVGSLLATAGIGLICYDIGAKNGIIAGYNKRGEIDALAVKDAQAGSPTNECLCKILGDGILFYPKE